MKTYVITFVKNGSLAGVMEYYTVSALETDVNAAILSAQAKVMGKGWAVHYIYSE